MADFPATFLDLLAEHVLFSTKNKQLKELQFYTEHSGILSKIHLPVESLFPEFVKSFLCSIEDQNPKKFSAFLVRNFLNVVTFHKHTWPRSLHHIRTRDRNI